MLGARVSLPSDRSFDSYDAALANIITAPRLDQGTQIYLGARDDGHRVRRIRLTSDQSDFAIRPGLTRLGVQVNVVLRFLQPGQPERAFDVHADTGIVHLDPRWHQAFLLFAREGFFHILDGTDHLLFLLCLVIPFRKFAPLVVVITSFTVAHSVTLIASAFGMAPDSLWFPPLIETLIAISILYMAFENIAGANLQRRWIVTFAFGLIHGFGFSFLLRERLQFAGDHLLASLLAFNVGVEIGQLVGAAGRHPALEPAVSLRGGGADGHHPAVGAGRAHRVALGHRTRRGAGQLPHARARAVASRRRASAADGDRRGRRPGLAGVHLDGFSTAVQAEGSRRRFRTTVMNHRDEPSC